MGLIPIIPPDEDGNPRTKMRAKVGIIVGVTVAILLGMMLFFTSGRTGSTSSASPPWVLLSIIVITAIVGMLVVTLSPRNRQQSAEKPKREGMDMYELIDRMVDDLDDDEAAYLQRRLDDRESGLRGDLADSAEDLLSRRAEDRKKGLRE